VFQAVVLDPDSGELSECRFEPSRLNNGGGPRASFWFVRERRRPITGR
jgi:hypothetical protein